MRREKLLQYLAVVVLSVCVVFWFSAMEKLRAARALFADGNREAEQARQTLKELQAYAAKERAANKPALSDAEVLELARLRSEVTRLRTEQRAVALTNSVAARRPPAPAPALPPPSQPVTKLTSAVSAQLPLGHALALGGWAGPEPGQRIVGFVTPTTVADSPGAVVLQTQLISIPDRLLDRLGLQDLRTDQAGSQSAAGLDPARL
ncbi:MAG: hypothetical protein ABMA26_10215, partial [Limisphaerales bacterium]